MQAGVDFLSLSKLGDILRERQFPAADFTLFSSETVVLFALPLTVGAPMPWHGADYHLAADIGGVPCPLRW